jgi:hypothetical protein
VAHPGDSGFLEQPRQPRHAAQRPDERAENNYRALDYAPLVLRADDYARIKAAIAEAGNPKRKLKVS